VSGPGLFLGYWQDEVATKAATSDGWFHTGDIAREESRNGVSVLKLVDRKKDIMITKGGKNIAPSEIESLLKASPYVSEAVLFADDRRYPTALVEIDFETVSEWARKRGLLYSGYTSLATNDEVRKLIEKEIGDVNEGLARVEQVKKFRILPKELDPEEGGTTPTRKVKRRYVYEMFQELVEGMYREDEQALATA
jgi:long-chain acyl-CoA synthetase